MCKNHQPADPRYPKGTSNLKVGASLASSAHLKQVQAPECDQDHNAARQTR